MIALTITSTGLALAGVVVLAVVDYREGVVLLGVAGVVALAGVGAARITP